jgi:hypothetical protein
MATAISLATHLSEVSRESTTAEGHRYFWLDSDCSSYSGDKRAWDRMRTTIVNIGILLTRCREIGLEQYATEANQIGYKERL